MITNNIQWFRKILDYKQPIALHGLFHEDQNGRIEDFHNFDFNKAWRDLKEGAEILVAAGKTSSFFIYPKWAVNKNAMDALLSLGFSLAETEEEILLLN
jgi:predicted deacetylase